jgi:hypothetical protein
MPGNQYGPPTVIADPPALPDTTPSKSTVNMIWQGGKLIYKMTK